MSTHTVSRRDFLRTAGAAVASGAVGSFAQAPAGKTLVYMGCYTARGQGIYIYRNERIDRRIGPDSYRRKSNRGAESVVSGPFSSRAVSVFSQ